MFFLLMHILYVIFLINELLIFFMYLLMTALHLMFIKLSFVFIFVIKLFNSYY